MSQSRRMSVVEAVTNTFGGLLIALVCQVILFVGLGIQVSAGQNVVIIAVMMVQSLIRQYAFRRFFVWLERREEMVQAPTPEGLYETIVDAGCLRSARWYSVPPDGTEERTN